MLDGSSSHCATTPDAAVPSCDTEPYGTGPARLGAEAGGVTDSGAPFRLGAYRSISYFFARR